ncbi:hypothetical protein Nepgr_006078 [Nepenthes gracilis]|uniref:Cytochrome P450 n=1 Tax=Nepenthes gracilis TaxID=150966 RepID=A0AAD3S4R1_NEPGR|nr:hypothetical protein Nepgr_006078 [Nepenthes gracilis]
MELLFSALPVFLIFIFSIFAVSGVFILPKISKKPHRLLPPGPRKLPLIGNIHQLASSTTIHRRLQQLAQKHGAIMHLQLGEIPTIVISSADAAKEVMKTHDIIFANRPDILGFRIITYGSKDLAFAPYGEYWRQLKKIATVELLSSNRVESFRSILEEEASTLIQSISDNLGSTVNLSQKFFLKASSIISKAIFGRKMEDVRQFTSSVGEFSQLVPGFSLADMFPSCKLLPLISTSKRKVMKQHLTYNRILDNIINDRKARRKTTQSNSEYETGDKDFLDVLLELQENGNPEFSLTDDHIKGVIAGLFGGGSDTSSITLEWAMAEMLKNSRVLKKAQTEVRQACKAKGIVNGTSLPRLKYLNSVIRETLRLHPPLPLLVRRESTQKCQIHGYDIPPKTRVLINAWAIARDAAFWQEADKFHPERFLNNSIDCSGNNFEYIPFGAGRRMCPGMSFGLADVEITLAKLLYHFNWSLPDGLKPEDLDMTEIYTFAAKKKNPLYLIPSSYSSSSLG